MFKRVINAVIGTRHERERKQDPADRRRDQRAVRAAAARLRGGAARRRRRSSARSFGERTAELEAQVAALKEREAHGERPGRARAHRRRADGRRRPRRRGGRAARRRSPTCSTRSCPRRSPRCARRARRLVGTTVDGHRPRADVGHGALRRAAHRRHRSCTSADRRDGDRRRQDARRDAAALPQRARRTRARTSSRSTTTSPAATRSGWGTSSATSASPSAASTTPSRGSPERRAAYLARHHLRHEQRVRLRLPARQHGRRRSTSACSARTSYAIVDEVDSVLIDEARTPLIISGPVGQRERRAVLRAQRGGRAARAPRRPRLVNALVAEARARCWRRDDTAAAALQLYQAQLGSPKNKRLLKLLHEPGIKQLVQQMELDHIADRKLPATQAAVCATSRRSCSSCSTRRGTRCTSPTRASSSCRPTIPRLFVLPDISQEMHRIEHDPELTPRGEDRSAPAARGRVRVEERAAAHRPPAAAGARAVRAGRRTTSCRTARC